MPSLDETHPLFPSGEWEGFFTYRYGPDAGRHPMYFTLQFRDGIVTGSGSDEVGPFFWRGIYDKEALRCRMTKYYASHSVRYDGHVDENGIWGSWYIPPFMTGGFHIWPKKNEADEFTEESAAETVESTESIRIVIRTLPRTRTGVREVLTLSYKDENQYFRLVQMSRCARHDNIPHKNQYPQVSRYARNRRAGLQFRAWRET